MRLALFAEGQGLPQLARIAEVAAAAAGWDAERTRAEAAAYAGHRPPPLPDRRRPRQRRTRRLAARGGDLVATLLMPAG